MHKLVDLATPMDDAEALSAQDTAEAFALEYTHLLTTHLEMHRQRHLERLAEVEAASRERLRAHEMQYVNALQG